MGSIFLTQIMPWAPNFAPKNWAFCDGALLPIAQNQALFSLLGTTYGGDGRVNFALPDLRGRIPIGYGQGPGVAMYYALGVAGGLETYTITSDQMPGHTHTMTPDLTTSMAAQNGDTNNSLEPDATRVLAKGITDDSRYVPYPYNDSTTSMASLAGVTTNGGLTVGNTGQGHAYDIRMPYLAVSYVICIAGAPYPSRN